MQELCATLMDLIAKTPDDFPTLFIMHFLSNPGDNKSSLMPDLSVRKLNVMCLACARLDLVREQGINIRKEISRSERIHQIYSEFFEEEANELLPQKYSGVWGSAPRLKLLRKYKIVSAKRGVLGYRFEGIPRSRGIYAPLIKFPIFAITAQTPKWETAQSIELNSVRSASIIGGLTHLNYFPQTTALQPVCSSIIS